MEKINSDQFEDKLGASTYAIMDFSSPGCAPCKKIPPLLEGLLEEMADPQIKAYEVDVTENISIAQKYMVMGVPTMIIFKDGKEIKRFNSVPSREKIKKAIK